MHTIPTLKRKIKSLPIQIENAKKEREDYNEAIKNAIKEGDQYKAGRYSERVFRLSYLIGKWTTELDSYQWQLEIQTNRKKRAGR